MITFRNVQKLFYWRKKIEKLKTFIRCDVAHTLKMIASWTELRGKDFKITSLYIRNLAKIILTQNIKDVESILFSIFTVALSETEGTDIVTGEITPCEIEKNKLKKTIATGIIDVEESVENTLNRVVTDGGKENDDEDFLNATEGITFCGFDKFAQSILDKCQNYIQNIGDDHDNHQYLPSIIKKIIRLMKFLLLITEYLEIGHFL